MTFLLQRRRYDLFRRGRGAQDLRQGLLGELPVLAELAAVVATGRGGAKNGGAGQHVEGWLLLDGISLQRARQPVGQGVAPASNVLDVGAEPQAVRGDDTPSEADLALGLALRQGAVEAHLVER